MDRVQWSECVFPRGMTPTASMLSNITITCFAASYAVALVLELVRAGMRGAWLGIAAVVALVAGLFAHSVHLWNLAQFELAPESSQRILFSNWHDWCLLAAWVLAFACLGLSLRKVPLIGIFMLPLVLLLIGLAYLKIDSPEFERTDAIRWWGIGHGVALLIGTVGVTIGFVAGAMFLLQAYRLKHKIPPSKTFKLPSLEWLQRLNEESLLISSFFLTVGLLTGIVLNVIQHAQAEVTVAWSEPTVWSSALLLLWLVIALTFNWLYKPARRGRKVAYLTMASFGFLAIVLGLVLFSQHASGGNSAAGVRKAGPDAALLESTAGGFLKNGSARNRRDARALGRQGVAL